jgi:hypothetical protein
VLVTKLIKVDILIKFFMEESNVWSGGIGEPHVVVVTNDPGGGEETFDLHLMMKNYY